MKYQHPTLAAGRWAQMEFCEQMAHIGSEISRALNWREKNNREHCENALIRGLELLSFTIAKPPRPSSLKELTRLREVLLDYFFGDNFYHSNDSFFRRYFDAFALQWATKRGR